jgi:sulfoxide reductase heme-binding subunit YedZ
VSTLLSAFLGTNAHVFWLISRAAGTVALLTSSASVCLGLAMGGRWLKGRGLDLRVTHEALSLATMVALVVHAGSLLGDRFLAPSLADITVPFASGSMEPWNGLGILAGWAMLALGLSYYFRKRIGAARWRKLHRFTALAWIAGVVHTIGQGTDAASPWFLALCGVMVVPALTLLAIRHVPAISKEVPDAA